MNPQRLRERRIARMQARNARDLILFLSERNKILSREVVAGIFLGLSLAVVIAAAVFSFI